MTLTKFGETSIPTRNLASPNLVNVTEILVIRRDGHVDRRDLSECVERLVEGLLVAEDGDELVVVEVSIRTVVSDFVPPMAMKVPGRSHSVFQPAETGKPNPALRERG